MSKWLIEFIHILFLMLRFCEIRDFITLLFRNCDLLYNGMTEQKNFLVQIMH